uniref:Uncharacterized protein n=1 Tax=Anopheles dirus TaxID=7168 RepID=A0A182NGV1_9DIPT
MSNCEENDENVLLAIAEIFDAIADGDEQALARCLESSTIGTMLQFEATYGATPLAYLVEAADVSHLGLVRRLLRSGLCDCEATDSKGRTVLARLAHAHNAHPAFVESIIQLVIEGADDATACFRMLKHNSTELFRTFLALRPMDEARLFQSLTSALTQLSVKRLLIAPELQVFALWKLADYGYRHLSGDWTGNDTDEWRHHIEVVIDCWSAIDRQYDTRKYEDVDDRLLHRLHVIHNHLYFLQHKPFLAYLPMQKVQAIDATNGHSDALIKELMKRVKQIDKRWTEKKMQELKAIHSAARDHLIAQITHRLEHAAHPQNVADRLIALSKQADCAGTIAAVIVASERFDLEHLMRGKDRRTGRRLAKCYTQMKQFYSLHKVIVAFSRIAEAAPANTAVFLNSLRRAVMVLGEAMKNTKSTPNMPNGRVEEAMNRMLTEQFSAMNIFHRDRYARGYSLTRLRVTDELERTVFREIPEHKAVIGAVLHLLYILALANIRRSFYGTLLRCGTLETLRALLMYVGEKDTILPLQHESVQIVQEYFTYVEALFAELRENEVSQTAQFAHIDGQLKLQCSMFEELQAMLDIEKSFDFQSLRKSCFSCNDLATVRRMFHWKMESYHPNRLLETICTKWDASIAKLSYVQELDWRLKWIDPTTISCKLGMLQVALSSADEDYCLSRTRELVESIGVADSVDEQALHMLRDMLRPYYENIFLLPSKWKVLETFCAHRQLLWDKSLARKLRLRDQEHLQALFDNRRTMLRAILEQYGVATADVLYVAVVILTDNILASLEYLQLELCEMLTAVGYFGDSFHYMKHRIPMIQGKNYRNLLAHDSLSYNLLTASGDSKLVINAFVFAQTDVRLFERQSNETVHLNFPTLQDTYRWVEEQQQLLAALKKDDLAQAMQTLISCPISD